jgi:hypothetical protein
MKMQPFAAETIHQASFQGLSCPAYRANASLFCKFCGVHYVKAMKNHTQLASSVRFGIASFLIFVTSVAFGQSEERALKMVQALRLGENLAGMTYQFAKTTTTYRGIEATLGQQKADELLRAEISVAVPKHQGEWNRNLAQAWAPLMTPEEFDSVVSEKQKSPFACVVARSGRSHYESQL